MRTREMLKRISSEAKRQGLDWVLVRHGANHDVYSLDGLTIPVPRHAEVGNRFAEAVYKECAEKFGQGWWR